MPPKYYCDFCDKTFVDSPGARKRHVRGTSHQRIRRQWYAAFQTVGDGPGTDVHEKRSSLLDSGKRQITEDGGNQGQTKEGNKHQRCIELMINGFCSKGRSCPFVNSHSGIITSSAAPSSELADLPVSCVPPSLQFFLSHPESPALPILAADHDSKCAAAHWG